MDSTPDEELLARAAADVDAFAVFYRRHAPGLLGYLVRRLGNAELAADVCAETFSAALISVERFDPASGTAAGWLFGISRHKLLDAERRGRAEYRARRQLGIPRLELTDEGIERVEAFSDLGATVLAAALAELPAEQQAAIRSRIVEEHSYAEIAATQATTEANVRQRVARGLAHLRRQLQREAR